MYEQFVDFFNIIVLMAREFGFDGLVKVYSVAAFLLISLAIYNNVENAKIPSIMNLFLLFSITFWMLIIAAVSGNNVCLYTVILVLTFAASFLQIKAL